MGLLDDAKKVIVSNPLKYWVSEPQEAGYKAEDMAAEKFGNVGEWTKADAAKHMAWQAELAKRTMLPKMLAVPVANGIGLLKEGLVDGLGSAYKYATGEGNHPLDTIKNSLMDIRNNYVGATSLFDSQDVPSDAVKLSGNATSSALASLLRGLPYASK